MEIDTLEAKGTVVKSAPVWIASPTPKYGGRKDIREFPAKAVDVDGFKAFIFDNTFREFERTSFAIGVGCEIRDDSGHYKCVKAEKYQPMRKEYPMLITERINRIPCSVCHRLRAVALFSVGSACISSHSNRQVSSSARIGRDIYIHLQHPSIRKTDDKQLPKMYLSVLSTQTELLHFYVHIIYFPPALRDSFHLLEWINS